MQWILLVLLTASTNGDKEGFLWHDPVFDTKEQCISWVNNNPGEILGAVDYYHNNWVIEQVICVREDRLDDFDIEPYVEGSEI